MEPRHVSRIPVGGPGAATHPIGFEMSERAPPVIQPSEVAPVPIDSKMPVPAPIGFEAAGQGENGQTPAGQPTNNISETDPESLFLNDGLRRIDFILAYKTNTGSQDEKRCQRRKVFEDNLKAEGLQLEVEEKRLLKEDNLWFIKVHATWDVLVRYAEIMNMKMPLQDQGDYSHDENDLLETLESCWSKCPNPFNIDSDRLPDVPDYFTAAFSRDRVDQFIIGNKDTFFTTAQRSLIVYQILCRAVYEDYGEKKKNKFGIKKMISHGCYVSAFPLHEGNYTSDHSLLTREKANDRHLLYEVWAKPVMWYKFQPLDHIRRYFGEKIGIYFSWLGYYTSMLIPAGLMGLVVFFYGLISLFDDEVSDEICDVNKAGNLTMCPLCDARCTYWKLKRSCTYSQITYLFDNAATVAFAGFMALWATFFAEMWKRRTAEIKYDWDVADFEEEETVRPEYEASVTRVKTNPINHMEEPYMLLRSRLCRYLSSLWVVIFMLCVVVAAVFGVIVYRITVSGLLYSISQEDISERATTITSLTAAIINLVIIIILGRVYLIIAEGLTNFETHRTQTEWEDSFTLKMFLFQFVNHYASLFYIAFFKGKMIGRPGGYNRQIMDSRQEECDPAGCLIELCIQLAVVMIGKQTINNFKELILPKVMNWFSSRKVAEEEKETLPRWEEDYNLAAMPDLGLFDEYLEMVIQYGFVTIFVAAFPLAPIFALLNNIIEIRLDAYKFVTQWQRPLASRAQDIGIWFSIIQGVSAAAVLTNACIIAFTSDFVPRLLYKFAYSNDNPSSSSMDGYINFTLSQFKVKDYENFSIPNDPKIDVFGNVTFCRYRDFRDDNYNETIVFWHMLAAKLAFIIVFILVVVGFNWLIMFLVPDVPKTVKLQMLREKHLAKEAILHAENVRRENLRKRGPEEKQLY